MTSAARPMPPRPMRPPPRRSSTCDVSIRAPRRKRMGRDLPGRRRFMHTEPMRTRLELLLLAALGPGPRPAHRLAAEVRRRGADASTDAVFDTLHRLDCERLVARRRGVYELTRRGRARLNRERSAWLALARTVAAASAP